ncbi:hypothetical protein [Aquirhabdus parva]|uniref:Uncharacterized protein n=1 Tax=Aquirhabdus parva TaxID=2283318 RepID=A0A345P354_9GAMM|nr:hypothetical protein [Aquirhabdus parva]AXI01713.1 hypothetical protein HYN46_01675 [Aquirhabdus parva]
MKKLEFPMQWYQEHINWMLRVVAGIFALGSCFALSDDILSLLDEYSLELSISVVLNAYFILVMSNVFFYGHTPKHWKNMDEAKKQLSKRH